MQNRRHRSVDDSRESDGNKPGKMGRRNRTSLPARHVGNGLLDYLQVAGAAKTTETDGQLCLTVYGNWLAAFPTDEVRSDDAVPFLVNFARKHQCFILARLITGDPDLARLDPGDAEALSLPDFVGAEHFSVYSPGFIHDAKSAVAVIEFPVRLDRQIFRDSFLNRRDDGLAAWVATKAGTQSRIAGSGQRSPSSVAVLRRVDALSLLSLPEPMAYSRAVWTGRAESGTRSLVLVK